MPPTTQPSSPPAPDPCVLVIFGASGDLTQRKLIPALFELHLRGDLPRGTTVIGVSRTPMSDDQFRERLKESARKYIHGGKSSPTGASDSGFDDSRAGGRRDFAARIHYHAADATDPDAMPGLADRIDRVGAAAGIARSDGAANLLFYLSVSPTLYEPIIESLGGSGLITEGKAWCSLHPGLTSWQRIIIEKPFGVDLASAKSLNRALGRVFEEEQIFRIDHYLGKELVQNILVMRLANTIFEPIWNRQYVDHVQVTAAETVGVGSRAANFYDAPGGGAVRDMIQSHLLQVMALVAMEPPSRYAADAIMREKIKLFRSARIMSPAEVMTGAALGRYGADPKTGEPAYVDEKGVEKARQTETYGAIRVEFDNWRWAGVPFYLRSGKKLASKLTEVVVEFRKPPTNVFAMGSPALRAGSSSSSSSTPAANTTDPMPGSENRATQANRLIINIAPREGVSLRIAAKVPGSGLGGTGLPTGVGIRSAKLDLDYLQTFGGEQVEAYGPLILDAIRGDRTLYKHRDEVESGWEIVQPILDSDQLRNSIETYAPNSWGPTAADTMLTRDHRRWHNPRPDEVR